jgi:hypothetical protein
MIYVPLKDGPWEEMQLPFEGTLADRVIQLEEEVRRLREELRNVGVPLQPNWRLHPGDLG